MSDEFTKCLLDERETFKRFHDDGHPYRAGRTLCGRFAMLVQTHPRDAPDFDEHGSINDLKRFFWEAWDLSRWFNHYTHYGHAPMYVLCDECAERAAQAFSDPRSRASSAPK